MEQLELLADCGEPGGPTGLRSSVLKKALAAEAKHDLAELEELLGRRQDASNGEVAAGGLEGNLSHAAGGRAGEGDGGAADCGKTCGLLEKHHCVGEKGREDSR